MNYKTFARMEGRPNLAGLLSGSPGSSLSSITAQKDVRELPVILGALGALCHPITAQKDVRNQTEGTREHRRMSGSTEGCQREPASSLYYYIYVIRPAKYHSFIESAIFHRFIASAKYHRFFSQKRAKNVYFVKKHENFSRKTKIFPLFLASFKNSLYLCTVKS
jgi:hypothetical protein